MKSRSRGGILWTFLSSPILMKSLRLSLMTSLPLRVLRSYEVRPPLVALPTLWDCSLLVSVAEPRAEVLLVEDDPPICLATLPLELLVDEDDSLTDDEERDEDELLTEEDLSEDELLTEEEPVELLRLLSCELLDTLVPLLRLLSCELPLSFTREEEDELLTEEEDLLEDELLTEEPEFLLLSCELRATFVEELRRLLS